MARKQKVRDSLSEVERQCQAMPAEYLACRELGHQWDGWTARYSPESKYVIERTLKCQRCEAEKDQQMSARDGCILWTGTFRYPEGYLFKGIGRLDTEMRGTVRLASVTHTLIKQIELD